MLTSWEVRVMTHKKGYNRRRMVANLDSFSVTRKASGATKPIGTMAPAKIEAGVIMLEKSLEAAGANCCNLSSVDEPSLPPRGGDGLVLAFLETPFWKNPDEVAGAEMKRSAMRNRRSIIMVMPIRLVYEFCMYVDGNMRHKMQRMITTNGVKCCNHMFISVTTEGTQIIVMRVWMSE